MNILKKYLRPTRWLSVLFILVLFSVYCVKQPRQQGKGFSFIVAADMRKYAGPEYQTSAYFLGACEAIKEIGKGEFMVSPGDLDPPWYVRETISNVLGEDYLWYPVIGNHELEKEEYMTYLREYNSGGEKLPNIVNKGPEGSTETMYSFNYDDAHFVVLNQYFDGKSDVGSKGDIVDVTYSWFADDLENNKKKYTFVFGHEPAFPMKDMNSSRIRHEDDSLNQYPENRDRFWKLLKNMNVTAFICGHTHNTSIEKFNSVYQLDAGHARGLGDKGSPSTFVKIYVEEKDCRYEIYRDDGAGGDYTMKYSGSFIKE